MNEDTRHIIQQINHVELENEHDDGGWKIVSRPIDLAGVQNIRDMGGIPTRDGRTIRPGMLVRSANLHKATDADLEALDRLGVRTVIDLRTKQERSLEEDRLLSGWRYEALPVFDEMEELGKQLTGIVKDPGTFIAAIYPQMLESPGAIACWKACFNELLDGDGGTLWHCTQGKDRTGGLAALILAALDVDDTLIVDDYLETNRFMPRISSKLTRKVEAILGARADGDINQFLIAAPAYIHAFMHAAAPYGGLVGFLRERVGLDDAAFARLRARYTEPSDARRGAVVRRFA